MATRSLGNLLVLLVCFIGFAFAYLLLWAWTVLLVLLSFPLPSIMRNTWLMPDGSERLLLAPVTFFQEK